MLETYHSFKEAWSDSSNPDGDGLQACIAWVMLQSILLWRFLDPSSEGKCLVPSLKHDMAKTFADVPFCWISAIFNLRRVTYNRKKMEASIIVNKFLSFY